ncbi:MAG: hypothetical protein LBH66_04845 [Oscillospiraceae bacterium]|jgi:hypothetical protein|nr:hypothetical protein [Oscillospiraceae bacterium]
MKRVLGRLWRGLLLFLIMIVFGALLYLSVILTDAPERRVAPVYTGSAERSVCLGLL